MINPVPPPHLFRQMIVANSRYWLARAEREELAVMAETPQLLKALDYVLALDDEAGTVGYELLRCLSPLMIRQGQFRAWEGLLLRGIARSAAEDHSAEIELRLHLGNIYRLQGRLAEAQRCLEAGLALCEQQGDATHQATLLNYLGLVARLSGQHEAALAYSRRVVDDPERTPVEKAEAFNVMGLVAYDRQEWEKSLHYIDQALALFHSINNVYDTARLLVNKGVVMQRTRRWEEAVSHYEQAIRYFIATNDQTERFKAIMNLGNIFLMREDYQRAIENYQKALPAFQNYGYFVDLAHIYNNLGMAYTGIANWTIADTYFTRSVNIWRKLKDYNNLANALDNFGDMLIKASWLDKAEDVLNQALQSLKRLPEGGNKIYLQAEIENHLLQLRENQLQKNSRAK